MTSRLLATLSLALLAAGPARAQQWEIAPLAAGGYTTADDIEKRAAGIDTLEIQGGFTWGAGVGRFFSPRWGAEILWAQQETALRIGTFGGSADLFDMNVAQLHGNLVYQFGAEEGRLRPFLFAGLGATFFSARDLETETKLSFALGAGLKYFPGRNVGVRLHVRYKPTRLADEAAEFCDPFGFCQGSLQQVELMAGMVLRFPR